MTDRIGLLKEIAACPSCRAADLEWGQESAECKTCQSRFSVANGIPVLLADEPPRREPSTDDPGLLQHLPRRFHGPAQRVRRYIRPSLTYRSRHTRSLTGRFVDSFSPDTVVLNLGAGTSDYGEHVLNLDIAPTPGIHVVGMAERLPFRGGVFDGVVLQAVLEHVTDARTALDEIRRVLRPGGAVFVEVPFIQGYHPAPRDHRRYTEQGLREELEQHAFTVDDTGVAVGPASALAWIAGEFLALLFSGRSARLYRFARLATDWLAWPIKWADAWLDTHEMAHVIASGVWAHAHKPAGEESRPAG